MRNKRIFLGLLAVALIGGIFFVYNRRHFAINADELSAQAIGLRDTVEVQRPLSGTQRKRLQQHFLDVPQRMDGPASGPPGGPRSVVDQVNRINALNQHQTDPK